jgi:hypothetical protein|tara:strand:- start:478 stop:1083 length:606 start_codon:yes stop_codon:yes gene_type:complete
MASNISDTGISADFPIAGQDNDSQGFRDNFATTVANFAAAKAEIEALQTNGAVKNADNNFLGNTINNANFQNTTETGYVAGATVNTSQNINLDNGAYQEFTVGADITLTLSNWSSTVARTGRVRLHIKSDQAAGSSTNRTITFASNAGGGTIKKNANWPTNDLTAVIGAPGVGEETKYYVFEFVSYDSGTTVWAEYIGIYQ